MVSISKQRGRTSVRINISREELDRLVPDNANRALVEHWIRVGREREGVSEHIEEVVATHFAAQNAEIEALKAQLAEQKKTLDSFISLFAQTAHALTISSAKALLDLEILNHDKASGKALSHDSELALKMALQKNNLFKQLLAHFFPDASQRFHLVNFLADKEKKDA